MGGRREGLDRPPETSGLIGRDAELRRLGDFLRSQGPVLNIHGAAGVGKSALVRTAIERAADQFDAVHHLDLSGVTPSSPWPASLAAGLSLLAEPAEVESALRMALSGRTLLVLDGAEQQVTWGQARALTDSCAGLRVLVVSVARLPGSEHLEVPSLPVEQARALFTLRAAELDVEVGRADTDDATAICAALDGLPLALELAAARLSVLPLSELARQVARRRSLLLLSGGAGRLGVRECLEVTLAHLTPGAATLFDTLGVFAGPWSLDDLVGVAGGAGGDLFDNLTRLVDLRLVELRQSAGEAVRYQLPELVAELARHRLLGSADGDRVQDAHASHVAEAAAQATVALQDARDERAGELLDGLRLELWAALAWTAPEAGPVRAPETAMTLAVGLAGLAWMADRDADYEQCRAVLERLVTEVGDQVDIALRRDGLLATGAVGGMTRSAVAGAGQLGDRIAKGLALAREVGEPRPLLSGLGLAVLALPLTGDRDAAIEAAQEGMELSRSLDHARWLARFEAWTGMICHVGGDYERAIQYGERALERALHAEDPRGVILAGKLLHPLYLIHGGGHRQLPSLVDLLDLAERLGDHASPSHLYAQLGAAALADEDADLATDWVRRWLARAKADGRWSTAGFVILQTGRIAGLRHDDEVAARLLGAAGAMRQALLGAMPPGWAAQHQTHVAQVRDRLGPARFDVIAAEGGMVPWETAIGEAERYLLDTAAAGSPTTRTAVVEPAADVRIPSQPRPPQAERLTPRELQVLSLIVAGRRNKEIADRLGVTPKTVMHHSVAVYRKLGVRGRAEAAVAALRLGLVTAGE